MHLWLVPLLPLIGCAINGLLGRRFSHGAIKAIALGFPGLSMVYAWYVALSAQLPYLEDHGGARTRVVIPDTAHGTNPATVTMCGYEVTQVPSNERGGGDLDALKAALDTDAMDIEVVVEGRLGTDIRVMTLPPGLDPDDVINRDPEAWRRYVADAESVAAYVIRVSSLDELIESGLVAPDIYAQVQAAKAMRDAAQNPSGGAGLTAGIGAGMGIGDVMRQSLQSATAGAGAGSGSSAGAAAARGVPDVMTPAEAAAILKVSEEDVLAAINDGTLKARKLGTAFRISKESLEEFLKG